MLEFNYAGACELIYDAHANVLRARGKRFMGGLFGLSLYGNYYYYALALPFSSTAFGLTCFSSFLLGIMNLNGIMTDSMTITEVVVMPTRDRARFLLMNGSVMESELKNVRLIKQDGTKLTIMIQKEDGKTFRLMLNTEQRAVPAEYVNSELLMAIGHPDVHSF